MRDRRSGKIVSIASDAPLYGSLHVADYSAAKLGTRGPRRMAGDLLEAKLKEVPLGAMCEPEDIANAVGFLASDGARFATGQNLIVNGRVFN